MTMAFEADPIPSTPQLNAGLAVSVGNTLEDRLEAILNSNQFSIAHYLNTALARTDGSSEDDLDGSQQPQQDGSGMSDDLGQRMAELALQLQLKTQACHEDIGKIGAELQAILPRCCADVGRIGTGLEGLRMDAAALLEATQVESEPDVSSSLETLSTLHALQANLTRTKDILTAAATWDATLESVAPLLAQQHLLQAVNTLAELEKGERALRGMPNPEQRTTAIAKIRQQVTTLLQPQLAHALANMHSRLAPLQQCVSLYAKLNQMETLQTEYVKNRPMPIHKAWFDYTPTYSTTDASSTTILQKGQSFLTWLPTWFDAVLDLITEERRQSQTIFGAVFVPEMLTRVLAECFRPILPSFKSRLESIYSSNPLGPNQGSLETVCNIYESSLQFLSLIYETIAGGWLDLVESGQISPHPVEGTTFRSKRGIELYQDLLSIFLQITSPFAPYQERWPALEAKYLGSLQDRVTQDIQQIVSNISVTDLANLQTAIEKLDSCSLSAVRAAQGGLARFELLLGGYGPTIALATIDKMITQHADVLIRVIHGLSKSQDGGDWVDHFEDSLVLCALNVLVIAGRFRREMRQLKIKTSERMMVLSERMEAHAIRVQKVKEALVSASESTSVPKLHFTASKADNFSLPDGLSAVEIDSIITRSIFENLMGEEEAVASFTILQRLAAGSTITDLSISSVATILYPEAEEALMRLAQTCQTFVFDVCFAVPRRHLTSMPSMSTWKEESTTKDLASYGILPQQYVTHIGEHMLALVQALEPFASDKESLALANEVMSNVRAVALTPWKELVQESDGSFIVETVIQSIMDGKEISHRVTSSVSMDEEEELEEDDENKAVTVFCNSWLDVVGLAVTGRLLERILRIPRLTPKGCEHLNADLNYLVNVFSALGVAGHPHPLLGHMAELALLDRELLTETIASRNRSDPLDLALASFEERLAAVRGVAAQFNY